MLPASLQLKNGKVCLHSSPTHHRYPGIKDSKTGFKNERAEKLLSLYFSFLKIEKESFIDLGPKRVILDSSSKVLWSPGYFIYQFRPNFKKSLLRIYDSVIERGHHKGCRLRELLKREAKEENLGLGSLEDKALIQLQELLQVHLGDDLEAVLFNKVHLRNSAKKFLTFLASERIKIPKDFMSFGILLSSLYLSLSKFDGPVSVRDAYLSVFKET